MKGIADDIKSSKRKLKIPFITADLSKDQMRAEDLRLSLSNPSEPRHFSIRLEGHIHRDP